MDRKSLAMIAAIAVVVAISGCTAMAGTPAYKTAELTNFASSWQVLAVLAVMISLFFVAIGYMAASLTSDEPFKAKVKSEFVQVFYSALIIVFAIALFASIDSLAKSVALIGVDPDWTAQVNALCKLPSDPAYQGPCHIAIARNYLDILFQTAKQANLRIAMINSMVAWLSSMSVEFRQLVDPSPNFVVQPFAGMGVMSETLGTVFDTLVKLMMFVRFQQLFLDLIYTSIFPLFLFTGVILRTFFFTRKLGGLMIAIALGMFITFPAMYAFTGYILYKTTDTTYNALLFNVSYDPTQTAAIGQDSGYDAYKDVGQDPYYQAASPPAVGASNKISFGTCLSNLKYMFTSNQTITAAWPGGFGGVTLENRYDSTDRVKIYALGTSNADEMNFTDVKGDKYMVRPVVGAQGDQLYMVYARYDGTGGTTFAPLEIINSIVSTVTWYFKNDVSSSFEAMVAGDDIIGFNGLIDQTSRLFLFTLVMPFVSLMVTIASIKVASPLLGGDTEIAGLTRII
ncbi:MAG: hypothetical protein WC506_06010 [Candidatus Micrarchaeia archaeon]